MNHPVINSYDVLKEALISRTSVNEEAKPHQLLSAEELGDRQPTELLRAMKNLLGGKFNDETILKELFRQRLPVHIQRILVASSGTPLEGLAKIIL